MHRFFIPKPYKKEMQITGRDAHHIIDVLRMVPGTHTHTFLLMPHM